MPMISFFINKCRNEIVWNDDVVDELQGDCSALDLLFHRTCNIAPFYVKLCPTRMYYVMHKKDNLTRATIHLGLHDHSVAESCLKGVCEQVKILGR